MPGEKHLFFSPQERVTLTLTEMLTLIANNSISDEFYDLVSRHSSQPKIAQILIVISTINAWNRIAITTGMIPSNFQQVEETV